MAEEKKTAEQGTPEINLDELKAEIAKLKGENEKLKNAQSNASSDAAKYKKLLNERMTEQEKAANEAKELMESLKAENERLKKEQTIASHTAGYLGLGFTDDLAKKAAEATFNQDFSALTETLKAFITAHDKQLAADALRNTPRPGAGGAGQAITKEQFAKMGYSERAKLYVEQPDLYKQLNE